VQRPVGVELKESGRFAHRLMCWYPAHVPANVPMSPVHYLSIPPVLLINLVNARLSYSVIQPQLDWDRFRNISNLVMVKPN